MNRLRHLKEHVEEGHEPHKVRPTSRSPVETLKVNVSHNKVKTLPNPDHHTNRISYIRYNFRPCQPLNGRKVYCSHPALVKYNSFLPEFSVGDIAVNHHVSNLGDHDLSKALLQDTRSGFHHSIGSSLSSHPHEGQEMRSTLKVHSHANRQPPKRIEIDFNGKNTNDQRITDALRGHPEELSNNILPTDLKKIFTENHIPDFQKNLKPKDIYKIFGSIFLRQAQILSAQQTMDQNVQVDTKLFAEPKMEEFTKKEEYTKNKIHTSVINQETNSIVPSQKPDSKLQEKHMSEEQTMPKPHVGEVMKPFGLKPKLRNKDGKKSFDQEATKRMKPEISLPFHEKRPNYKAFNSKKDLSHSFNPSADRRNTYSARKRNKLGNAGFHYSMLKSPYQHHSGEDSANYPGQSTADKRKNKKFVSRPVKNYKSSVEKMRTIAKVANTKSDKKMIDLVSENNLDVLESDAIQLQDTKYSFQTTTPRVDGSAGFGANRFTRVSLNSLGLEKSAVFPEAVNSDLSNHIKVETVVETEKTTTSSTPKFDTKFSTITTTQYPATDTTSIPPETTEPVRTTLGNGKVRFPILRERNSTSIPIRNMLDGYHNMLAMLTERPPSKDQKPL